MSARMVSVKYWRIDQLKAKEVLNNGSSKRRMKNESLVE